MAIVLLFVLMAKLLVVFPAAAEESVDSDSGAEPREWRYSPPGPVMQLHLGVGSGYQAGLGVERFHPWLLFPGGFVEHGAGIDLVSEWDRSGFRNLSVLGRVRAIGAFAFPAILGIDLFAGGVSDGHQLHGVGGFSVHIAIIYFDFGYRYQRVLVPLTTPDWYGRHFFFLRFGVPIK